MGLASGESFFCFVFTLVAALCVWNDSTELLLRCCKEIFITLISSIYAKCIVLISSNLLVRRPNLIPVIFNNN